MSVASSVEGRSGTVVCRSLDSGVLAANQCELSEVGSEECAVLGSTIGRATVSLVEGALGRGVLV